MGAAEHLEQLGEALAAAGSNLEALRASARSARRKRQAAIIDTGWIPVRDGKRGSTRLAAELEAQGWTQLRLAAEANISNYYVNQLCGGHAEPRVTYALAIAAALDCAVEDLWRLKEAA